jgi:hypothetical protein
MRSYLLTATMVLTCFLFGAGSMYLIDSTWVYDRVEKNKEQLNNKMTRYIDALDVSHRMVSNCYDAFYTVSRCSTKDGCDLVSTADSLSELNLERKILKVKLNQLLNDTPSSWSK